MIRFLISAFMTLGVFLTAACAKFSSNAQLLESSHLSSATQIFEKSVVQNQDDAGEYIVDINQEESQNYDLTVGVDGLPPPPPPRVVQTSDPLVIQVKPGTSLVLSGPNSGVIFDLFGDHFLHDTYRVSWLTNSYFGFLALPNETGEIEGIHQLFGDGTRGPDRKPASHGFEALEKYDGLLQDGSYSLTQRNLVIDKSDAIFSKLRVWIDTDLNGKSSPSEMKSLEQLRISSINLKFDRAYSERDEHGNIISYKSNATRSDGQHLNVFNLWLRYISAK